MAERKKNTFQRLKKGQLNRKERRDLERQLNTEDPGLEIVNRNGAGIDVGNETHYVAVPPGRDPQPVQEFGSWTADLERMADWLKTCGIETVVMQSTGVLLDRALRRTLKTRLQDVPGQCAAYEESAGPQERCSGEPVAAEVTHLRPAAELFPPAG